MILFHWPVAIPFFPCLITSLAGPNISHWQCRRVNEAHNTSLTKRRRPLQTVSLG